MLLFAPVISTFFIVYFKLYYKSTAVINLPITLLKVSMVHFTGSVTIVERGAAGYAFKKAVKVRGIFKTQLVRQLLYRTIRMEKQTLSLQHNTLMYMRYGRFPALLLHHLA